MIKFLVDSASDYDRKEIEEKNMEYIPIAVTIDDKTYYDGKDITKSEFFQMAEKAKSFPKTAQPSPHEYVEVFQKAKNNGDEIIAVTLASELSGTYQSANLAKSIVGYDKIYIIDSCAATYNIKFMVDYGINLRNQGKSAEEIVSAIEGMKGKVTLYAVLDTLDNLYKGGRLSKLEAGIGSMARIKPLITLTSEGKVGVKGKSVGRKKALKDIMKLIEEDIIDHEFPVYCIYSYGMENCNIFMERAKESGINFDEILQIGPTIGTHIGPEAYGIIYVKK